MVLMERERERETRLLARQFRSSGQCTAITVSYSCTVGWKPGLCPFGETGLRPFGETGLRPFGETGLRPFGETCLHGMLRPVYMVW